MTIETIVADHYTTGGLFERVKAALARLGIDPETATADDLKACDEFHTGGAAATELLVKNLAVTPETRVLDIGCGIGGPARFFAGRFACHATGIDLTPEFVDCAARLSALVGMADKTTFVQGSALDLPFEDASFDLALLLHVGMNIQDKARLFDEAFRVLAPGGTFAVFDVMRGPVATPPIFPMPWASVAEASFVSCPSSYREAALAAGFEMVAETDRTRFAKEFFAEVFAKIAANGPSPLGIHLMMGDTAGEKIKNYVANLEAGRIAPTELIFRVPA
ncbi:class I SAM-dependent methyltransferase [Rhodobacteraceae bacterium NNCM2]|nr:class I SAM-dependent methyltransferase [Coraliihabitans acroporae]